MCSVRLLISLHIRPPQKCTATGSFASGTAKKNSCFCWKVGPRSRAGLRISVCVPEGTACPRLWERLIRRVSDVAVANCHYRQPSLPHGYSHCCLWLTVGRVRRRLVASSVFPPLQTSSISSSTIPVEQITVQGVDCPANSTMSFQYDFARQKSSTSGNSSRSGRLLLLLLLLL